MGNRVDYAKASPDGFKAFGGAYVYLRKSGLAEELTDLVYLRVSQINGCAYCIDMHSRDLLKLGITVDKLGLARRGRGIQQPRTHRAWLVGNRNAGRRNRRSRRR